MGANFISFDCAGPRSNVSTVFRRMVESVERPGSYSGDWDQARGLVFRENVFDSYSEAEDWIENNAIKWEAALAVQYRVARSNARIQKLKDHYNAASNLVKDFTDINLFRSSVLQRIQSGKSALKTVECCSSKLAVKYLSSLNCPVCRAVDVMLTDSDKKRLERLMAKKAKLEKAACDAKIALDEGVKQEARRPEAEVRWLVGCLAAC